MCVKTIYLLSYHTIIDVFHIHCPLWTEEMYFLYLYLCVYLSTSVQDLLLHTHTKGVSVCSVTFLMHGCVNF